VGLTAEALAAAGVPDAPRVVEAAAPLAEWIATAPALLDGLRAAADPVAALHGLEALLGAADPPVERLDVLLRVLGGSPSLATTLAVEGAGWPALLECMLAQPTRSVTEHVDALERAGAVGPLPRGALQAILRRHRRREILRIGGRDIGGLATVDDTVRELSALAEGLIEVATRCVRARVAADWGGDTTVPFVVLGMGKLGGEELNYSSDVDLVYVYGEEADHPSGRSVRLFFAKVAEEVTKAIADVTDDGLCFRVDVRLRPGGDQSPLAVSVAGTLGHYEAWGQTWERSVWLKARPVGGDRALGAALMDELHPFVYRRFLDFATLEDLNAMKRRVDQSLRHGQYERDVKLGRGGIREIEFWVQAHQLVHAGKDARLQVRGTLPALERLAAFGYVDPALARRLAAAYRFLRDVEHKIQIARERQSQHIPAEPEEYAVFVRRLGYLGADGAAAFEAARAAETDLVHTTFAALFHGAEETRRRDERPDVAPLMDELDDAAATRARLTALGFRELDVAAADLRLLRDGPSHAPANARRTRALGALAPALVSELARVADPDRALHHLASFIGSIGARTSFLHLLLENPGVMRLLVRLFGTSEFLSRDFLRHPELLDSLVRADLVRLVRTHDDLAGELDARLASAADLETRLDVIRRFRHEEFLRIGVHDIEGELAGDVVREQLSTLAEVALAAAVGIATDAVRERLELPAGPPTDGLAIVGLGKLGGGELNYHSDLDIIFLYDAGPEAWWTARGMAPHEFFSRVAQRTISALQTPTREGIAYKIDTRLRPSGNQGTLVSSLTAFEAYHAGESGALWERQALAKARLLTGPAALRVRAAAVIERVVYGRPLTPADTAEMAAMRARIATERGTAGDAVNIKTDWGGLVDVEFAVQMLQLRHGHDDPRVRQQATRRALDALIAVGALPADDGDRLRAGYAFLRDLEGRLRIERDQPVEAIDADPIAMLGLARRLGYQGTDDQARARFVAELARHRTAIREVYDRLFDPRDSVSRIEEPRA
jgi:glutamate-ammonia-ligase adenylyltransferase